jgi:tetraacyldisaccharide 4'-kinase
MKKKIHFFFHLIWKDINFYSILLLPLSFLYVVVFFLKKKLCLFKIKPNSHTIIIGNISVGGTGKTPFIIELIKYFKEQNITVGVVSKGYGRKSKKNIFVENHHFADIVGDEPLLIKKKTDVKVLVGNSRKKLIRLFEKQNPNIQVLLFDDGLQDNSFYHNTDIVMFDGDKLFGNHFLIPAGPLRESINKLKSYDLLICKKSSKELNNLPYPYYNVKTYLKYAINHNTNHKKNLRVFKEKNINLVTGIGNPESFYLSLKEFGFKIEKHFFPDHHNFKENDFKLKNHYPIFVSEKDAVKFNFKIDNLWVIPMFLNCEKKLLDNLLNRL